MYTVEVQIASLEGLHAQLASKMVQAASKYSVDVELQYGDRIIDAKSILGVMSLAIPYKGEITLKAIGVNAENALADIILALEI